MFADRVAFVDLETTGMSPGQSAITEIGMVLVTRAPVPGNGPAAWHVEEWSSLVNPLRPIPPEIQFLTGISNDMVASAPTFADLADDLRARIGDAVFVAHHVRFDYGFLKHAFAECGHEFSVKTLCTVRLSKLLDPDRSPHSLDALMHRHNLGDEDRHRALGDARLIYRYLRRMYERRGAEVVEPAIRRLLKQPSLPAHLPANALSEIPNAPGIYRFLGENNQPLYVGKSVHLRERVASHFVNDHRSERGVRLASEIRRIDWQRTAGDLGAQLLERTLIRAEQPSHNAALRRRLEQVVLMPGMPTTVPKPKPTAILQWQRLDRMTAAELPGWYGPFSNRAAARRWIAESAASLGICLAVLGFERRTAGVPCFNRQLGRCQGACVGAETTFEMAGRLHTLLAPQQIPVWPYPHGLVVIEHEINGERVDHHVFDDWCYLGSEPALRPALLRLQTGIRVFDADCYRLLIRALAAAGEPAGTAQGPALQGKPVPDNPVIPDGETRSATQWRLKVFRPAESAAAQLSQPASAPTPGPSLVT